VPCQIGVEVSKYHHSVLESAKKKLDRHPETEAVQLGEGGQPLAEGAKLLQPALARTYLRIAREGADAVRRGPVAEGVVSAGRADGGVLSLEDLASYQPVWREPVHGEFKGYEVIAMPPPSSGGVHVIQMLNALEKFDLARWGRKSSETLHV